MLIPNKHEGYSRDGRRLYYFGDDGGGAAQTQTVTENKMPSFAPEIAPYAQTLLGQAAALTDTEMNPYMQYQGERTAQFSPLQTQSYENMALMQSQPQLQDATALAGQAGLGALNTQYTFDPSNFNKAFGAATTRDAQGNVTGNTMMNPYMNNVVARQQQDATRQAAIAGQAQQAQAARSGAFGGSGDYLMRGQAAGNLARQKGDIQAQGLNNAYNQAMQQYNTQNQQNAQQQQYGAGLGLQGLQMANQSAQNLGTLAGLQYQQNMGINQQQNQYGLQQQAQVQQDLTNKYQDYLNSQNYPYKQMGFMSDMIRGLPLGQISTQSMYPQAPTSTMGQIAGLGMGAYGVSQLMKADGGMVHDYAEGGVTSDQNVEGILSKLSDQQLQQAKQGALARRDVEQANMIDAEMAMRASARRGIGAGISPEFADQMEEGMASGGIVAFADRGAVEDQEKKYGSVIGKEIMEGLGGFFDKFNPSTSGYTEEVVQTPEVAVERSKTLQQAAKNAPVPKAATPSPAPARKADVVERDVDRSRSAELSKQTAPQVTSKKSEAIFSGPKPSKAEVKSAVAQFAEQRGATPSEKEDYMATALKIREELGKQNQPILDKLNAAIEGQRPDERALKDRGIGQAFAQFGFAMAERASRPGARFLESAAGASPVLASVAEKTNSLIDAQKQNYTNLKLDQAKYEVALAKGDMQTAATLAGQIRQANQNDQMLEFNIAKAKDELALKQEELRNTRNAQGQMASRYETIGSLTRDIMQNEGLPYDRALEKAARLMKPTGYAADTRADATTRAALASELVKIEEKFPAIQRSGTSKLAKTSQAAYENAINNVYRTFGAEPQGASNASTISPSAFKIEKIGK
jgi:hypothetical protein